MRPPSIEKPRQSEIMELRDQLARVSAENARLRGENHDLRAALDAHIGRACSVPLYGSLELTAGTSVGPRRRREIPR
jgi:hypothetical protein